MRTVRAVLFDFYGTLARDRNTWHIDSVMREHGYELPDHLREMWWNGDVDGLEHLEASRSRDHYVAWQDARLAHMLAEADIHPGERSLIAAKLRAGRATRELEAYPEVRAVLTTLRRRGVRVGVCSNWDWDLEPAVREAGLRDAVDSLVSSAWAGARKPHPRIFEYALDQLTDDETGSLPADQVVFVGDTWGPDVDGPRAFGMTPLYLERDGHWPDPTAPEPGDGRAGAITRARDLTGVFELL